MYKLKKLKNAGFKKSDQYKSTARMTQLPKGKFLNAHGFLEEEWNPHVAISFKDRK